jgi:hypothetical protein
MRASASVRARSPDEAAERGLEALDLLRAYWNLELNRAQTWRVSMGRPRPVNKILLSPFHTVHDSRGDLATESFWYEPGYVAPDTVFFSEKRFDMALAFAQRGRRSLEKSSYREDLRAALIRYVRALDSADLHGTFLRLWGLLEFLTDSTNDGSKTTIRRAAFLFRDRERSRLVLSYLATFRNRFVHAGSQSGEIESLVFQLKRFVDQLISFHLLNSLRFDSRSEAAQFLNLPVDPSKLRKDIRRMAQASKLFH